MIIPSLHFEWSWGAVFFLLLPLIGGFFYFLSRYRKKIGRTLSFPVRRERWKAPLVLIGWVLLTLAVMGPKGDPYYPFIEEKEPKKQEGIVEKKAHEIIFLLDTSRSMSVPDTRIGKSRLFHAQEIIDDIASELKGESASLFAFNSRLVPIVPDTYNLLFLRLMTRETTINEGGTAGTNLTKTLQELKERIAKQPEEQMKSVILLSDGEETADPSGEREKILNEISALNTRVYTVGVGTEQGGVVPDLTHQGEAVVSRLEEQPLRQIAEMGRGVYFNGNRETTVDLAGALVEKVVNVPAIDLKQRIVLSLPENIKGPQYRWYFQWPLGAAILLLGFLILKEEK